MIIGTAGHIDHGKTTLVKAITEAGAEAEAVDTADPAAFQSTITGLVSTFQSETETVGNSFSELDAKYPDPDLNEAVGSACSFL